MSCFSKMSGFDDADCNCSPDRGNNGLVVLDCKHKGGIVNRMVGEEIQEAIVRLVRDKLGIEVSGSETNLLEYGMIDSLKFVDLVYGLEQEFGVVIPIATLEIEQFRTVADIGRLVVQLKNSNAASDS